MIEHAALGIYTSEYYRRLFDIEQYTGFQFEFSRIADSVIRKIVEQPVFGMDILEHI